MSKKIRDLPGLGMKSEEQLARVGVLTEKQLRDLGAIEAYRRLKVEDPKVSLNFLYAIVGALEGISWLSVAKERKSELILQLDAYDELERASRT